MKYIWRFFTHLLALSFLTGCTDLAGAKLNSEDSIEWLSKSLEGLQVEDAVIAHSGMDGGCLYLKTGGTVEFRGYYVFKIDPQQVNFQIFGDQKNSATIEIESIGQTKILKDARLMDGSNEPLFRTKLLLDCKTRALAEKVLRALNRLKQKE